MKSLKCMQSYDLEPYSNYDIKSAHKYHTFIHVHVRSQHTGNEAVYLNNTCRQLQRTSTSCVTILARLNLHYIFYEATSAFLKLNSQ